MPIIDERKNVKFYLGKFYLGKFYLGKFTLERDVTTIWNWETHHSYY